jgi:hypothetical protein
MSQSYFLLSIPVFSGDFSRLQPSLSLFVAALSGSGFLIDGW